MDLSEKITVLTPPRGSCQPQNLLTTRTERLALVDQLAALRLPVGTPKEMERESVPSVEPLP